MKVYPVDLRFPLLVWSFLSFVHRGHANFFALTIGQQIVDAISTHIQTLGGIVTSHSGKQKADNQSISNSAIEHEVLTKFPETSNHFIMALRYFI